MNDNRKQRLILRLKENLAADEEAFWNDLAQSILEHEAHILVMESECLERRDH